MKSKKKNPYRNKTRVDKKFLLLTYRDCYVGRGSGYNFVKNGINTYQTLQKLKKNKI